MKKVLRFLLIFVMIALVAGCAKEEEEKKEAAPKDTPLQTLVKNFNRQAEIEKTTLYDKNNVKIELTDMKISDKEVTLNLKLTNDNDTELSFVSGNSYNQNSINGYMIDCAYMETEVEPNDNEEYEMKLDLESLSEKGITEIADISLGFTISATDSASKFKEINTGAINVKTSLAENYDYTKNVYEEFLNNDFAKVFASEVLYYSDEIYSDSSLDAKSFAIIKDEEKVYALLEVNNKAKNELEVWAKNVSLNDEVVEDSSVWLENVNTASTLIAKFDITSLIEDYEGETELSPLSKFKFTLSYGKTSNKADKTKDITIDLSEKNINIK